MKDTSSSHGESVIGFVLEIHVWSFRVFGDSGIWRRNVTEEHSIILEYINYRMFSCTCEPPIYWMETSKRLRECRGLILLAQLAGDVNYPGFRSGLPFVSEMKIAVETQKVYRPKASRQGTRRRISRVIHSCQ